MHEWDDLTTKYAEATVASKRIEITSEEAAAVLRQFMVEEITTREGVDAFYADEYNSDLMEFYCPREEAYELAAALATFRKYPDVASLRETVTDKALNLSLCPFHFIDYAICFDDEDPVCSMIRLIHPSHDT